VEVGKESGEAAEVPSEHHELVKLSDKPTEQDDAWLQNPTENAVVSLVVSQLSKSKLSLPSGSFQHLQPLKT